MTEDDFRPLPHHELARLSDEQLLGYVTAGKHVPGEAARALEHLVDGYLDIVKARLRGRVPDHLLEDMTHDVLVAAIEAALAGKQITSFRAWLDQVVRNTRAEFYRGKDYRQLQQDRAAAAHEHPDEEGRPAPQREQGVEGEYGAVELQELIDELLKQRSPAHRRVLELYVFGDHSAKDTAEQTGESSDNVYKIAQRFRDDLKLLLEGGELDNGDTDAAP